VINAEIMPDRSFVSFLQLEYLYIDDEKDPHDMLQRIVKAMLATGTGNS
jgi:hypothetical protein